MGAQMEKKLVVAICNRQGLHARPCHAIVTIANGFAGEVRISAGEHEVNGKSILELMTLNAGCGTKLEVRAIGEGAERVLEELLKLVNSGFGEERES